MRLWPPLWQDTSIIVFHQETSLPPLVCLALLHAPFEPRYTYTTRSLVCGSRVWLRSNLHRRAGFLSLSLIFEGGGFSQRNILYFSKSTINFYRLPGDGYRGRKKNERREGGWKFQLDSISGGMDGWMDGRRERSWLWLEFSSDQPLLLDGARFRWSYDTSYLNFLLWRI